MFSCGNKFLCILSIVASYVKSKCRALKLQCLYGNLMQIPFPELNFSQFVNQNVKILHVGRRLYSPSLKDVAVLEVAELFFKIFHTFVCTFFPRKPRLHVCLPCQIQRQMYGKFKKIN